MPLIKPVNMETVAVRAKLPKSLGTEIEQYITVGWNYRQRVLPGRSR